MKPSCPPGNRARARKLRLPFCRHKYQLMPPDPQTIPRIQNCRCHRLVIDEKNRTFRMTGRHPVPRRILDNQMQGMQRRIRNTEISTPSRPNRPPQTFRLRLQHQLHTTQRRRQNDKSGKFPASMDDEGRERIVETRPRTTTLPGLDNVMEDISSPP